MHRRSFLGAVAGLAGLAGCTSTSTPATESTATTSTATETATPTDTPTATPGTPPAEKADARIDDAVDHLEEAQRSYRTEANQMLSAPSAVTFDAQPIRISIGRAREDLTAAEGFATPTQMGTIRWYRTFASYVMSMSDALQALATGVNDFDTAISYESVGEYGDAADTLQTALESFETAQSRYDTAADDFSTLRDQATGDAEISYARDQDIVDNVGSYISGMVARTAGAWRFDDGLVAFDEARDDYNDQRYAEAKNGFKAAQVSFARAARQVDGAEDEAHQSLKPSIISLSCLAEAHRDASAAYYSAATSAQNENWAAARDSIDEGTAALERCSSR